ncbi:MAG: hypothetical protein JWO62_1363 [Acidimicrobiaceae bacterium]|nr:hypothetical protein [Acidimicrobiaceae bacterium]
MALGALLAGTLVALPAVTAAGLAPSAQQRLVAGAESELAAALPSNLGAPAPATPAQLFRAPLGRHEVMGFVPGSVDTQLSPADLADTSIVSYYGIEVSAAGSLVRSGSAWQDQLAPSFASFVASAHGAGDKVLVSLSASAPAIVARLLRSPASSATRLATDLVALSAADSLDGFDLDIEGHAGRERSAFDAFVADLSVRLKVADPVGMLVVNTYATSALDPRGFFDVAGIARHVDQLFVMGYDMVSLADASPNAPLAGPPGALSDIAALDAYVRLVPATKLVLGIPFYGYDFPTVSGAPHARATTTPYAVTYASIVQAAHRGRWDPVSLTPYYSFERAGHWHETWYDDPVSVALKTAVASELHLAGVGAWSLGQELGETAMLAALDGGSAPLKYTG